MKRVTQSRGLEVSRWSTARPRNFETALLVFAMLFFASAANACPVCFGGPNSITKGMDTAIFFLLTIVALVQVGFVALFWSFRRRAKELQRRREQFHLINGGVR